MHFDLRLDFIIDGTGGCTAVSTRVNSKDIVESSCAPRARETLRRDARVRHLHGSAAIN